MDKSGVSMIDDEIQDNTVMNDVAYLFPPFCTKLRIQQGELSEMTSYRANEDEAILLFSRLLIVASFFVMCTCKKW